MNINFIVHSLDRSNMGGVIKVVTELANILAQKNIRVTIYSIGCINSICFEVSSQVTVIALNIDKHSTSQYFGLKKINWFISLYKIFYSIIGKKNNEIWLPTSPPLNLLFSILKYKLPNIKVIGCDHTSTVYSKGNIVDTLKYFLLKNLDCMVALTKEDQEFYVKNGIKSTVISNPIDLNSIVFQNNKRNSIIFVGRFSSEKQPLIALKLYYESKLWKHNINFRMYGNGPLENELRSAIKVYGLENNVLIVNNEYNPNYIYKNALFLLMTSKVEGLPMVLLEAIGRNIPCLAFDCPYGPRNIIISGVNGFLVEADDFESALKILSLDNILKINNENIINTISQYDINNIVEKWLCILNAMNMESI